ncbi:hypothetical protein TNCV_2069101 [Trichonephila clavipes]|uniref:Uncharacterized protein n=1 Tax=Trichonephila clavipes TaxID=2585209 RepID=A0A8X6W2X0_TRICX|nr:hypothetical protein TNCV_2069101 [Trichonephila clavipes]
MVIGQRLRRSDNGTADIESSHLWACRAILLRRYPPDYSGSVFPRLLSELHPLLLPGLSIRHPDRLTPTPPAVFFVSGKSFLCQLWSFSSQWRDWNRCPLRKSEICFISIYMVS